LAAILEKAVIPSLNSQSDNKLHVSSTDPNEVQGTVFEITKKELFNADKYEVAEYMRVSAKLKSGKTTWMYAESKA
jgi:gamma-glutamylcyclotransferase (GGCT)/AIG2-like uncharacterized protein YtfP